MVNNMAFLHFFVWTLFGGQRPQSFFKCVSLQQCLQMCSAEILQPAWWRGRLHFTTMWVEAGVTQPLCSILNLAACSNARLHFTAAVARLHFTAAVVMIDRMILYGSNDVTRVSDAFPLYIFIFNIRYSTPLTVLPSETCSLLHWEHSPLGYDRPMWVRLYYAVT